jgi:g-D-glutamyl-meso-diaminopimelate peptidase
MDVMVRQGDSLWYYSQLFHLPHTLLIDSNRNIQPNLLSIGQRVKIPGFMSIDYQIQQGDSLWSIAANRNLSLDALFLLNPSVQANSLQIGQIIKVPQRITWRLVEGKQNYSYERLRAHLERLQTVYPFIGLSSIGDSVLEREIPEVLIGKGNKNVHYNASFHANEWITTSIIMTFLNDYLLALTNIGDIRGVQMLPLYEAITLSIVPMVNPDGVNLVLNGPPDSEPHRSRVIQWNNGSIDFTNWKANIRGVDLNDQFPAKWELEKAQRPTKPGPRDYPGESPLIEPEAIAMAELTRRSNFSRVLAFHTQGKEIYWGFENLEPPYSKVIVEEFSRASGYKAVQTLQSYAGYKDWFIQDWRRPGFTIEFGQGVNPLPLSQFEEIYQESLGIFLAGLYM